MLRLLRLLRQLFRYTVTLLQGRYACYACYACCAVALVAPAVLLRQSLRQLLRQFSFPFSVFTFPLKKLALCLHNWQIIAIFVSY